MTTENIRITGYIVPDVYDRFEEFCKENKLNCSKALNVILAEYLGVEIKIVEQTWIGGVTLPEFEKLKKEVQELKELVNILSNLPSITPKIKEEIKDDQRIVLNTTELAKRLKVSRGSINTYKRKFKEQKITKEEYIEWTRSRSASLWLIERPR